MSRRSLLSLVLTLTILMSVRGQEPKVAPKPTQTSPPVQEPGVPGDEEVVRITANLVQVDAVVTDKKRNQITDLTDQDFEVLEDGRRQKISNLSYITSAPMTESATETAPKTKNRADQRTPTPPVQLRPEQVQRTIALVVDDLGLSFESTAYVRQALKNSLMNNYNPAISQPLFALARVPARCSNLPLNKRLLYAAIDRVRWYPFGRGKVSTFDPIDLDPLARFSVRAAQSVPGTTPAFGSSGGDVEQFRQDVFSVGTLDRFRTSKVK